MSDQTIPQLYTRTFSEDELLRLVTAVGFTRRMLDAADYPQSTLDDLDQLAGRVGGTDFAVEGLAL